MTMDDVTFPVPAPPSKPRYANKPVPSSTPLNPHRSASTKSTPAERIAKDQASSSDIISKYPITPAPAEHITPNDHKHDQKPNHGSCPLPSGFAHPGPPRTDLLDAIRRSFLWKQPEPRANQFAFKLTKEAAVHNYALLRSANLDLQTALDQFGGSSLHVGSEFKPSNILEGIFAPHPLWPKMKALLDKGATMHMEPIPEEDRLADLTECLASGNHKSAQKQDDKLRKMLATDVKFGFALPLPTSEASNIPNLYPSPMGISPQWTITEFGEVVMKDRLTHDQSFSYWSGLTVNSRVRREELTNLVYGKALPRFFHYIVDVRLRHPLVSIYLSKSDYKAAYRRVHYQALDALASACPLDEDTFLVYLRMTFGGAPNPNSWSDISESACDLVNEMMRSEDWTPEEFSPYVPADMPEPSALPLDIPFAKAHPLSVKIEPNDCGKAEVFIDDQFLAVPALGRNLKKAKWVLAIVISILERPVHDNEPIMREHLLSLKKFAAEGRLEEIKIILGWVIDTRRLRVSLPDYKVKAWTQSILDILKTGKATLAELETLVGRLNHIGEIARATSHFLGRIRYTKDQCKHQNKSRFYRFTIGEDALKDLALWVKILAKAGIGFSMNNLVYREVDRLFRSDSSETGLGGYCLHCGKAWRYLLPPEYRWATTINTLEFMSAAITPMVEDDMPEDCCFLCQTDSTTGEGWLKKTNFHDPSKPNMDTARWFGEFILDNGYSHYSQHFAGKKNIIADILSRDFHLSDNELIAFLRLVVPEQVHPNFRICPLPKEIISKILCILPQRTEKTLSPKALTTSETWRGPAGKSFVRNSNSMTSTSPSFDHDTGFSSSWPSPKISATEPTPPLCTPATSPSSATPPKSISRRWERPLGMLDTQTPDSMIPDASLRFYRSNGEAIQTTIEPQNQKKRSQAQSSGACTKEHAPKRKSLPPNSRSGHISSL
jgi:hypothetical protein